MIKKVIDLKNNKEIIVKDFVFIDNKVIINGNQTLNLHFKLINICEHCAEEYSIMLRNFFRSKKVFICKKCKTIKTNLKKYGTKYSFQSENNKRKSRNTCLCKYGVNHYFKYGCFKSKYKNTLLKKYGVDNVSKIKATRNKAKNTLLKRYGVKYFSQTEEWHNHMTENKDSINEKIIKSKKRNNSFHTSKLEEEVYRILKTKYTEVIKQYRDERYPFLCDFYIPEKDLFIEVNFHWTHGKMIFLENNTICLDKLNEWEKKAKESDFYKNAIKTWTVRDRAKRKAAKENNLNYLEFFNLLKFQTWVKDNHN